jgi:hypothetical protein
MAMKGSGSGGYGSRPDTEQSVRTGTGNRGANPAGVSQLGNKVGNHVTSTVNTDYTGDRLHGVRAPSMSVPFGNEKALDVGKGGCGTGRTIYGSGSQSMHGSANPGNPRPNTYREALEQE